MLSTQHVALLFVELQAHNVRHCYLESKEQDLVFPCTYSYLLNGFAYGFPPSTTTLAAFLTR